MPHVRLSLSLSLCLALSTRYPFDPSLPRRRFSCALLQPICVLWVYLLLRGRIEGFCLSVCVGVCVCVFVGLCVVCVESKMIKASDNDFNRAALQQSLQFWRGEPKPAPVKSLPSTTPDATVTEPTKVAHQTPANLDTRPHPWRYVRWRKAHDRLPQAPKQAREIPGGNFYHRVLPDEDLIEVAEKFSTYPEVLMEANQILNPVNVATGQVLWVPRTHAIEWGNTLWSLSHKYNVPIRTIQNANGIANPDLIYAGDILVVPEEPDNRNAW